MDQSQQPFSQPLCQASMLKIIERKQNFCPSLVTTPASTALLKTTVAMDSLPKSHLERREW